MHRLNLPRRPLQCKQENTTTLYITFVVEIWIRFPVQTSKLRLFHLVTSLPSPVPNPSRKLHIPFELLPFCPQIPPRLVQDADLKLAVAHVRDQLGCVCDSQLGSFQMPAHFKCIGQFFGAEPSVFDVGAPLRKPLGRCASAEKSSVVWLVKVNVG